MPELISIGRVKYGVSVLSGTLIFFLSKKSPSREVGSYLAAYYLVNLINKETTT